MTSRAPDAVSTPSFTVTNPFDQSPIGQYAYTREGDAIAALEEAYRCHRDRAGWLSKSTRIAILEKLAALIEDRTDALAQCAAREGGKPLKDSIVELRRAREGVKIAANEIAQLHGTEVAMDLNLASAHRFAHTFREPRGVVLAISAFNHPFNLIVHQVVTAVAAGCPVLVKPALSTPMSCINLVELLYEAGLPRAWCHLLFTTHDVTEKLVADRRIAFLTFIGSAAVGWHLRAKLAPGAHCALEHGGIAPAIVDETADIDAAIPGLTRGGFYHAGQVCVSVQRIYVQRRIVEPFLEKFVAATKALRTGDPLDPSTDVGPLISPREVDRVDAWVHEALTHEQPARLIHGGRKLSATTYEPTVLLDPSDDARVSNEEIFGPIVSVYTYDTLDEAIARANEPDVFFQASIFTRDLSVALDASRRLHGMAVMVNDHTAFRVDWMPFGGHRQSGLGVGGIGHAMREMTLERMVVFHSPRL
ncbi:MAG: aldehyde dehydrogenase family protein [Deltaproteobacteria bacterium]|nr:aldehyde dehydrogenase family protein [Deltaproteobacteria bacterium]